MSRPFVPEDFAVPRELQAEGFRLEPLGPRHNVADHAAWTSSIEHIRATPGFRLPYPWPPAQGMSLADNLSDLEGHADEFVERVGFTYSVIEAGTGEVVGCVYIRPSPSGTSDADVRSWVRADRAALDAPLHKAVSTWLETAWPFQSIGYEAR
jgi:hypothetical protein